MDMDETMMPLSVMFEQPAPPPLNLENLRLHFKNIYKLKDEQVEFMIKSAVQSLQNALASAEQALTSDNLGADLALVSHSFKGLFLNLGEKEWAALARAMEQSVKAGQTYDYAAVVEKIRQGVLGVTEGKAEQE